MIQLSGSGSVQHVALIEQSDKEKKNKGKTKVSETQPMSPPEQQPPSEPTLFHPPSIEQVITSKSTLQATSIPQQLTREKDLQNEHDLELDEKAFDKIEILRSKLT